MQRSVRIKKELERLERNPLAGVSFWTTSDLYHMEASLIGPDRTPYENGVFKLDVQIPERYPFEPPKLRFITPVYHPNIDTCGRICLDVLKMPPNGSWKPTLDVGGVLTSIQLLLSEPNPDDPLMAEIAEEYKNDYSIFVANAKKWTEKHAMSSQSKAASEKSNGDASQSSSSSSGKCKPPSPKRRRLTQEQGGKL